MKTFPGMRHVITFKTWKMAFSLHEKGGFFHVYEEHWETWFVGVFQDQEQAVKHCLEQLNIFR